MPGRDQAAGLRSLFPLRPGRLRLVPLVTPEGGGDQEGLAIDLAAALARHGERVLLLDGEAGRIAPMLGLRARYDLRHVLSGERPAETVALPVDDGFWVMPAARGLQAALRGRSPGAGLHRWLVGLGTDFDAVVACATVETLAPLMIDADAAIVLACGTEAWQVARAYARIKVLHERHPGRRFRIAYCPAASVEQALAAHARLGRATSLHLDLDVAYAGAVVDEPALRRARDCGLSLFEIDAECEAARAVQDIALASGATPARGPARAHPTAVFPMQAPGHVHRPRHA